MTGTPLVSRYSSVRPRSRMALAPAQTTSTGVRPSSSRSAEISIVVSAPRCTPPMPPVANTWIPARCAMIIVVATVVAPSAPRATSTGRSRREAFVTAGPVLPRYSISSAVSPAFSLPLITQIVAGTAPASRTVSSTRRAVSTFCGYGIPWEMMVDSRATTGSPDIRAAFTAGDNSRYSFIVGDTSIVR